MKKQLITSTLLLLSTTLGSVTAAADSRDIQATYSATHTAVTSVDITWGSLKYTYSPGNTQTWDPTTHQFVPTPGQASWQSEDPGVSDIVKVTNHSNTPLEINKVFVGNKELMNGKGTIERTDNDLTDGNYIYPSQEGGSGQSGTYQLTLSGTMKKEVENTSVGAIHLVFRSGVGAMPGTTGLFDLSGVQGEQLLLGDLNAFDHQPTDQELTKLKSDLAAKGARLSRSSEIAGALGMLKQTSPNEYAILMTCKGFVHEDGIELNDAGTEELYAYFETYERTLK